MISIELGFILVLIFVISGIVMGLPLYAVFGIGGLGLLVITGAADPSFLVSSSLKFLQNFAFLALPLYVLLGRLMEGGVLSDRLLAFLRALLPKVKSMFGGQAIIFSAFFGAISGSAIAACAAIGSILIPKAEENGYTREYMTGVIVCSCLIAMLIPPSIDMIIFGFAGQLSVARCFLATAVPGLLITTAYLTINFVLTRKFTLVRPPIAVGKGKELLRATGRGWSALVLPVIILGGIYGGVFTPTEAGAVAVAWVILDGFVLHREFIPQFKGSLISAGNTIGSIAAIVFFIFVLSKVMIWLNATDILLSFTTAIVHTQIGFLIMANVLIILLGMLIDDVSICLLVALLLLPVAKEFGIDPYHFAAIVGVNAGMANLTPPVAPILYFGARIGGVPLGKFVKTVACYLLFGHLPVLILVTYVPQVSLWLPTLWAGAARGG